MQSTKLGKLVTSFSLSMSKVHLKTFSTSLASSIPMRESIPTSANSVSSLISSGSRPETLARSAFTVATMSGCAGVFAFFTLGAFAFFTGLDGAADTVLGTLGFAAGACWVTPGESLVNIFCIDAIGTLA